MSMSFFRAFTLVAASVAVGSFTLPAAAANTDRQAVKAAEASTSNRDKNGWVTTMAVPKPPAGASLKCQGVLRVAGHAAAEGPYSELQARHNAIEAWRTQVSAQHGYEFTHWWRAQGKDVSCREAAGRMSCEALAAPCKSESNSSEDAAVRSGLGMVDRAK